MNRKSPRPSESLGIARDRALEQHVIRIHQQGPRALLELLRDLGAETMRMTAVEQIAARYAALNPATLGPLGADRFPPRPSLRLVEVPHD
jgi:hypothetical protein